MPTAAFDLYKAFWEFCLIPSLAVMGKLSVSMPQLRSVTDSNVSQIMFPNADFSNGGHNKIAQDFWRYLKNATPFSKLYFHG